MIVLSFINLFKYFLPFQNTIAIVRYCDTVCYEILIKSMKLIVDVIYIQRKF